MGALGVQASVKQTFKILERSLTLFHKKACHTSWSMEAKQRLLHVWFMWSLLLFITHYQVQLLRKINEGALLLLFSRQTYDQFFEFHFLGSMTNFFNFIFLVPPFFFYFSSLHKRIKNQISQKFLFLILRKSQQVSIP